MTRFLLSVLLASCILFSSLPAYAEPVDDQATTVEPDQAVPMQGVADSSVQDETEGEPASSVEGAWTNLNMRRRRRILTCRPTVRRFFLSLRHRQQSA